MDFAIRAFKEYVEQFDKNNANINSKIEHTFRVVDLAKELAAKMNLNKEDTELIMIIALLHDIGRFYQVKLHDSFSDFIFDHAAYGVEYLFNEGHIKDYVITRDNDEIIKNAIYYHSRYTADIPQFDERTTMFVNLIRDLDKIDIYYVVYLKGHPIFSKNEISPSYLEDILNKRLIKRISNEKKTDGFITLCGFIYDFNYKDSVKLLKEKKYLDLWFSKVKVLDNKELFLKLKQDVYDEMNERLINREDEVIRKLGVRKC